MIVEHEFITTIERDEAMTIVEGHLIALGYRDARRDQTTIEMRAGRPKPRVGVSPFDQPQRIRVGFDRGRITVAAVLEVHGNPRTLDREAMLAVVSTLERAVTEGLESDGWLDEMADLRARIDRMLAKRRRGQRLTVGCLVILIAAAVTVIAMAIADAL